MALPQITACNPLPDQTAVSPTNAWTDSFQNIQCYDMLKVNAIVNQANGKTHNGMARLPVPTIFGMNFQAVSVGEKLIEKKLSLTGGYLDFIGTPSPSLLSEIQFVDASIGKIISALKTAGVYSSTLIVITAKHGQSPVNTLPLHGYYVGRAGNDIAATILDNSHCLPLSKSPSIPLGSGRPKMTSL